MSSAQKTQKEKLPDWLVEFLKDGKKTKEEVEQMYKNIHSPAETYDFVLMEFFFTVELKQSGLVGEEDGFLFLV